MDRSADVHEIPLTLEFPALGLSGTGRKLSEDLVRFFLLSIRVHKRKECAYENIDLVGDFDWSCTRIRSAKTYGDPVQPEFVPLQIDLSDLMDLPAVLVVLSIDVLVLGFTDGEPDVISRTNVPSRYPVVRLDKLFLVQDSR
jgi:hypothetical protein